MITELQVIGEVALAMVLGGVIGFDREQMNKPAGLRTHMLVAGAASLLVGLGDVLVWRFAVEAPPERIRSDPISSSERSSPASVFSARARAFATATPNRSRD